MFRACKSFSDFVFNVSIQCQSFIPRSFLLFKSNQQATVKAQLGESLPKLLNLYSKYCEKGGSSEGQPLTAKDKQDLTTAGQDIEDKLGQTGQSQIATQLLGNFGLR
jgi:hypothetical protein